ncbi:hypothetical protein [Brevundimonas sp.]|uniref:hypothetical protein n=1 Tax=Brevundimonas sp. TaxID=1871086 RepID=UPI00261830C7|nr:hypothetical protein [Brevundimonas sp.]
MTLHLDAAFKSALTAKGSGRLSFSEMIALLEAAKAQGLPVSAIDATGEKGRIPRCEFSFYVHLDDLEDAGEERSVIASKSITWTFENYAGLQVADDTEFEVWLRP